MAEVISSTGDPLAAAFGRAGFLREGTPIYVNATTGDLYVLTTGDVVTKVAYGGGVIGDEGFWATKGTSGGLAVNSATGPLWGVYADPAYWMGV
jgi:hypothetical protein